MNGYQRVMRSLRFEETDRAAIVPELIQHNLNIVGETHSAFSGNPNTMCKVILAGLEKYETDAVYVSSDNYLIVEAMGGKVELPPDEPPRLLKTPVSTLEEGIELAPLDVRRGRIPVILDATRRLREVLKDEIFVKTCIDSAPFSAAAAIMGPQNFMINLIDEPELCHTFLENCTESVIRYGLAAAEAGAHGLAFGDSASVLVNRDMYAEFALPYARKAINFLQKETGLPVFYHVCGDTKHILDLMVQTGADCLEIDSMVPMVFAKDVVNGRCALEGNVSTIEAFYEGTPEDVTREANAILDLFGNRGGLILSSACEIPRHSPEENVHALTDAVRKYPYQDDAARCMLGSLYNCIFLDDDTQFPEICRVLDFLVKTTGKDGCRISRSDMFTLTEQYMEELAAMEKGRTSAHYNGYYLASLLLAYKYGKNEKYLEVGRRGLETLMTLYPDTDREQSETQEMCRLVLPLAALYDATREERHREMLYRVVKDLETHKHPSGGYCEWDTGYTATCNRESPTECSLLTENGDPVADLLYSVNWLPVGFAYAYYVTGDEWLRDLWKDIVRFCLKSQIISDNPLNNGSWCRAFDMDLGEAYACPHDTGWAAYASETGWTIGEILTGMMFMEILPPPNK